MGERETLWLIFLPCFKAICNFFPQEIEEDHLEITGSLNGSISIWMLTKTWDSCHPKSMMCFGQPGIPKLNHFHLPGWLACMLGGVFLHPKFVSMKFRKITQDSTQIPHFSKNYPKFPQRISSP